MNSVIIITVSQGFKFILHFSFTMGCWCFISEKRIYGCYLSGEQDEMESQYLPKEAKGFMFAPKDSTPWQFEGKDDLHGIGYSGMQEQSVLGSIKATRALYGMSGEVYYNVCLGLIEDKTF